jgi:hypothetical protein
MMQYSTQPIADLAAGTCFAFALEPLFDRCSFRRALRAGVWLGLGFMVAYKTLLVSLLVIAFLFLRDRFKHSSTWRGLIPGLLAAMLLQCFLDWWMYGTFGKTVYNYLAANVLGVLTSVIMRIAIWTKNEWLYWKGTDLYQLKQTIHEIPWDTANARELRQRQHPLFYILEFPTFFVWPVIAVSCLAVVRTFVERKAAAIMLLVLVIGALAVMSNKGSKDFRLMLQLLPLLAPLVAYGWEWVVMALRPRGGLALVTIGGAIAVLVLSVATLQKINVKHFGGYWAASDWVDEHARATYAERLRTSPWPGRDGEPEPLRVGFAYHWAVYCRHSPLVEVVKLPWQLNLWKQYEELKQGGLREKADDFATLEDLDVFVVHLPILSGNDDLMRFVNTRFEVIAAFYDQRTYDDIGPIFVMARRTGSAHACTFFEVTRGVGEADFTRARQIQPALDFLDGASGDRVRLLGVEYKSLPPQEFGWITYHWRVPHKAQRDWFVLDRMTSPHETNVWENNHAPAYGTLPTSTWNPDEIVSESYVVVPSHRWSLSFGAVRPIGDAYRRGDLIPTRTWMKLVELDPETVGPGLTPAIRAEMMPARIGAPAPVRTPEEVGLQETPDGIQFAADDFVRVGGFFIPVRSTWRLPDDGRPVED